ncbi:hypothetical protein ACOSQ4_029935 [Xanthoceras sorbifolium]
MFREAKDLALKCDRCQRTASIPRLPSEALTPMASPWPFAQWGIDIIGPLPTGSSQKKYAIVAIDYFIKWVEAEALVRITESKATEFVKKAILYRFGVSEVIVTDHGTQFDNRSFRAFCQQGGINLKFASPAHLQTNGQKGGWVEKLPEVLWAVRTTPHSTTGETPFSLAFGTEAVLPTETTLKTRRVDRFSTTDNEVELQAALDELESRRDEASLRIAALQQKIAKYYNSKARIRKFQPGELVLKKVIPSTKNPAEGTLRDNWERPPTEPTFGTNLRSKRPGGHARPTSDRKDQNVLPI